MKHLNRKNIFSSYTHTDEHGSVLEYGTTYGKRPFVAYDGELVTKEWVITHFNFPAFYFDLTMSEIVQVLINIYNKH